VDLFFVILGILLLLTGIAGCVLPVLPGPPISYVALLMLQLTHWGHFSSGFLWGGALVALVVTILDYWVPAWGTKKFGGTKRGVWGASVGLLIGLFVGPLGIIIAPFMGALIGELSCHSDTTRAIKAAFGSFIGIITGMVLKLTVSVFFACHFFKEWLF
jgi:uncharacterized protein YqgC (DUF456 family)